MTLKAVVKSIGEMEHPIAIPFSRLLSRLGGCQSSCLWGSEYMVGYRRSWGQTWWAGGGQTHKHLQDLATQHGDLICYAWLSDSDPKSSRSAPRRLEILGLLPSGNWCQYICLLEGNWSCVLPSLRKRFSLPHLEEQCLWIGWCCRSPSLLGWIQWLPCTMLKE